MMEVFTREEWDLEMKKQSYKIDWDFVKKSSDGKYVLSTYGLKDVGRSNVKLVNLAIPFKVEVG